MVTVTISGTQTGATDVTTADIVDATAATFRPPYPVGGVGAVEYPLQISNAPGATVAVNGGIIEGAIPSCVWWASFYNSTGGDLYNSTALLSDGTGHAVTFDGWRIGRKDAIWSLGDGVRFNGGTDNSGMTDFEVWHLRDDLIESDDHTCDIFGTNVFADFGFAGVSATGSVAAKTITLSNFKCRLTDRWGYGGGTNDAGDAVNFQQGPVFKCSATTMPAWIMTNCVWGVETASYIGSTSGDPQTARMLSRLTDGGGNEFLFLGCEASDNADHPDMAAAGFTVYENQAAIERWNYHKSQFLGHSMVAS
jgi:hypothetical protein